MSVVSDTWKFSDIIEDQRSVTDIMLYTGSEFGELSTEVWAKYGNNSAYAWPGPDGIVGEAIDTIICLLDMIRKEDPGLTEVELEAKFLTKLRKWKEKSD